ncbi:serine hydrolase [Clostridium sp.]|uniref:serine hydrolase n=1 Tax=Clostridium sp. TaxID=1506 RepID=UPI001A58BA04|nr:serine hydrolase [Clostridium sp.]MBK5234468.1 serine hydrolase [Clostridium sp.]
MGKKDIVILLAIMAFFATLTISKQRVEASGNILAFNYSSTYNKSNNDVAHENIPETGYELLSYEHLLQYRQSILKENSQKQAQLDILEKKIRVFVGDNINKFGMVYYDINSKEFIEINSDKQFAAASTIKVPINMLMYDMVQDKKIDMNEKLKYKECDFEEGAGILQDKDLINPIALKTLSDYSIIYSDNIAINMILGKVGNDNKYNYIEKIVGHPVVHEGNNITPKDSFKILERLYLNPENNKYYSAMIETMKKTKYHDRIDKYIPREIVAHKIGDFATYVNDTAIVYKENPYIIVIFTKEVSQADEVIAKVSKMVYDAQK